MRIAQIVPRIEDEASGPSYSVPMLCESLAEHAADVDLYVLDGAPAIRRSYGVRTFPSWGFPKRLGVSPRLRAALREAAQNTHIMHSNGLWMMSNVYPGRATHKSDCRLVVSPRGTLSKWAFARSRWTKRVVWNVGQRAVLSQADCFHATAEHEYEDIRRMGFTAPVAVIPNGVEIPEEPATRNVAAGAVRRLLFLGRIHPTKGIDVLLRGWRRVQARFPDWELSIVGPDKTGHLRELTALADRLGCERLEFSGPVFGASKSTAYRSADLFVLPSHSENFGVTVTEALSHELPVIVTKGAPWSGVTSHGCGWWIDMGVDPLVECLVEAMAMPSQQLIASGRAGRRWVEREFSWRMVGKQMHDTYRWLLGERDTPHCVRTD
jgi:glycosyltransferase involved in cell wall biosynthesis